MRGQLTRDSQDPAALRMLAEIAAEREDYVEAERLYALCLKIAPGYSRARFDLARTLHMQQKAHPMLPLLERDWGEGVKTNVFGSINVADAAIDAGAAAMVMISTDKAIEPVSVLGATKRFAEMYCQALDAEFAQKADAGSNTASVAGFSNCARSLPLMPRNWVQTRRGSAHSPSLP